MLPAHSRAEESLAGIAEAARNLQFFLNAKPASRELAFNKVSNAASEGNIASKYFSETKTSERSETDWFSNTAAAALELRSARVLTAVAAVRGEIQLPSGIDAQAFLGEVISDANLELNAVRSFDSTRRFAPESNQVAASPDFGSALESFRGEAGKTVSAIVDNSERVLSTAIDAISKQGGEILGAFRSIAQLTSWGNTLTGFVSQAWEKIKSAFKFLQQLTNSVQSEDLERELTRLRELVSIRNGLESIYHIHDLERMISQLLLRPEITIPEVDRNKLEVVQLEVRFAGLSKNLKSVTAGISLTGLIIAHFSGPTGLLMIPAGNALVVAAIVTAGLDFLGEIQLTEAVRGVRQVAKSLMAS